MTLLVACDKFRGSLSATEANSVICEALDASHLAWRAEAVAIADGGEGTLEALGDGGAEWHRRRVSGPYGDPVEADWLFDPVQRRAVVEVARVAGHAAAARRGYDPDRATSAGVGELIAAALDAGAREVVVALGGSITVDAGAGALGALGARFRDAAGRDVPRPAGRALHAVAQVDLSGLDPRLRDLRLTLAADVDNPLVGCRGAARVFGPQKGVPPQVVDAFDAALAAFDRRVAEARGAEPLAQAAYAGAAGGLMVGLCPLGRVTARDGFALVAEHHRLTERIARARLVVTGEGSLDSQSLGGKGPVAVARMAARAHVPAIAFAGRLAVEAEALEAHGLSAAFAIARGPATLKEALADAPAALRQTARHVFNVLALSGAPAVGRAAVAQPRRKTTPPT